METTFATEAGADVNEDAVAAGADFAVVLDGATAEPDTDAGCRHGVRWFATQLAGRLAARLSVDESRTRSLADILHDAIEAVGMSHVDTCDLGNPCSPSSTVALVRQRRDHVDYLVLGDSPVVFARRDGAVQPVTDDRLARFDGPWCELRQVRNVPGGVWVAGNTPAAAEHAVVGSVPVADIAGVALFSDGVTRLVDRYGWTWRDMMAVLDKNGPADLIASTRAAERTTPGFPGKPHDDATAVLCRFSQ
ncbi:protein phosphatase 2C domain-containing protein [Actinocrispum wychmicini]|uniref:Protein phosphatase 2C-like protein n=1 Tax=Actinocrispum wychmicini TaxID=1213861 RepID=A0A4V2S3L4_9PSEU|nr:protein phosphatase 2C domain-containing protein [Actinocrispum wychmicini]TCO44790.1 protein phosphatase 2C-like protein [Actinocrispum wychmicini]